MYTNIYEFNIVGLKIKNNKLINSRFIKVAYISIGTYIMKE